MSPRDTGKALPIKSLVLLLGKQNQYNHFYLEKNQQYKSKKHVWSLGRKILGVYNRRFLFCIFILLRQNKHRVNVKKLLVCSLMFTGAFHLVIIKQQAKGKIKTGHRLHCPLLQGRKSSLVADPALTSLLPQNSRAPNFSSSSRAALHCPSHYKHFPNT